jgi:hypothetical protein
MVETEWLRASPISAPSNVLTVRVARERSAAVSVHAAWQRQIDLWVGALSRVVLVQTPDPRDRCRITHNRVS